MSFKWVTSVADMAAPEISLESLESLTSALRAGSALPWQPGSVLQRVFDTWLEDYDRGAPLHEPPEAPLANDMHIVGACVCVLLGRSPQLCAASGLRESLGGVHNSIILSETPLAEFSLDDVQNAVAALQLEFTRLYEYAEGKGYRARCDVEQACVLLLARLGQWLAVRWRGGAGASGGVAPSGAPAGAARAARAAAEMDMPGEALRGQATLDADGFCHVRLDTAVFVLDAVHSMLGLHRLLVRARARDDAAAAAGVQLAGHHLEASGEVFFTHSMTADCVVGTVAQYAHKFAYLFHSISQTIYYNRPSYQRKLQLPLAKLQEPSAAGSGPSAVNLLALLLELRPDVPVLFEHTGAGHRRTHAQHAWAWVLWTDFVLLVDAQMGVSAAIDARALAALLDEESAPLVADSI
jgi:hypothetical protein